MLFFVSSLPLSLLKPELNEHLYITVKENKRRYFSPAGSLCCLEERDENCENGLNGFWNRLTKSKKNPKQ